MSLVVQVRLRHDAGIEGRNEIFERKEDDFRVGGGSFSKKEDEVVEEEVICKSVEPYCSRAELVNS